MPDTNKTTVLPLATDFRITSTDTVDEWNTFLLELPEARQWGPFLSSIRVHSVSTNMPADFEWRVVIEWSADGMQWESATPIGSALSSDGQAITNPAFTDASKFGLFIRFSLQARKTTGAPAGVLAATVSATGEFNFKS